MKSLLSWAAALPMGIAVIAGAVVPFQAASNAALGRALGHPLWATLTSLAVSIVVVIPVMLWLRVPAPAYGAALHGPLWLWLGGVAGVIYITAALVLTPKVGVASFMVCVVAGQMLASLLIDYYGWMGLTPKPVGLMRVAGVALILIGMVSVQWGHLIVPERPADTPATLTRS